MTATARPARSDAQLPSYRELLTSRARQTMGRRRVVNYVMVSASYLSAVVVALPLILILVYLLKQGASSVGWAFFTKPPVPAGEPGGGMANAMVGTLFLVGSRRGTADRHRCACSSPSSAAHTANVVRFLRRGQRTAIDCSGSSRGGPRSAFHHYWHWPAACARRDDDSVGNARDRRDD
jgi:hypothetical protein